MQIIYVCIWSSSWQYLLWCWRIDEFCSNLDSTSSILLKRLTGLSHTVVKYCQTSVSPSTLHSGTGTKSHSSPYRNCGTEKVLNRCLLNGWMNEWENEWRKEQIHALTSKANLSLKWLPQTSRSLSTLNNGPALTETGQILQQLPLIFGKIFLIERMSCW